MHGMDTHEELVYWRERAQKAEAQLATTRQALTEACDLAESLRPSALSGSEWPVTEDIDALRAKIGGGG